MSDISTSPRPAELCRLSAPSLAVVVDTEEEFDWSKPHSRSETGVDHIKHMARAQSIFERYGVHPTYVVDFPVASQEAGYRPLREWLDDGRCEIGAHLHPWVNPPFEEEVCTRNSYPGNLPPALEKAKLARLTAMIEEKFGRRPTTYRAGRYGVGPATAAILEELGYEVDTSVVPFTDFGEDGGPNFTAFDLAPFWTGPAAGVLEIPLTAAWCGSMRDQSQRLGPWLMSPLGIKMHIPGVFARLRLLERIRLTPEGITFDELKRLVDMLLGTGERLFVFSYHSPTVVPGNTPYVRSAAELEDFLSLIERFCDYFFGRCGGEPTTMTTLRAAASPSDKEGRARYRPLLV